MLPVVVANARAQRLVAARTSDRFDPLVFIGRHRLLRELPPDPVRLLRHDHAESVTRCGQRRRTATKSSANDDQIGSQLLTASTCDDSVRHDARVSAQQDGRCQRQLRKEVASTD